MLPPTEYVAEIGEPSTVLDALRERAERTPDDPFVTLPDAELTYAGALDRARNAAGALASLGVTPGDRVAVMLPNCAEFLDLWFGIAWLGAVLVPVNTHLRGDGLRYIVEHSGAVVAAVDGPLAEHYDAARAGARVRLVRDPAAGDDLGALLTTRHDAPPPAGARPGDLHQILYTSGTTGLPKGVMTPHNAYVATGLEYAQRYIGIRDDDRLWTCLPLFHINAQAISVMPALLSGRPLTMAARFSASGFLEEMRRTGTTVFNYIGSILQILLKQPERDDDADNPVRLTMGSSAPRDQWEQFERRYGVEIVECYGLTESAGVALANPVGANKPRSIGVPVSWAQVDIHRPDGSRADDEEPGEIVIRSKLPDLMFQGYYRNDEATTTANRDGWFHSGDRGRRSADGYFEFIDRLKDSMRRRGENISSTEVERIVNDHPAVLESAAVGVPSELGEDEVMVVVVLRDGHDAPPAEIVAHCEGRLAAFAVPRFVRIVDELPKTPTEKVQKFELRALGAGGAWDRQAPA